MIRKNVEFAKRVFADRLGDPYEYGDFYDPNDVKAGADCSGANGIFIGAALLGAQGMSWTRQFSTESFPGPFKGFRQTTQADLLNGNYPIKVCIHHGGGGPESHMQMQLDGVVMESNGSHGTCTTGRGAMNPADNYWNDWWVFDGQIVEDGTPRTEIPVTRKGLDYAGGRPSGAAIKAAGYDFVVRYLSDGGSGLPGKLLQPSEVADLRANGISIVSNWETTGTTALNGFNAGVSDAQAANAKHLALGGPADRPIYFSLDWDEAPGQDAVVFDYFRGVASVIGLSRTAVYGAYWISKRLLDAGLVSFVWQTQAWSGGNSDPRFNLMQNNNAGYATVSGVQCDINYALTDDFGQWDHAPSTTGDLSMADASTITALLSGLNPDQTPLKGGDGADYRRVDFLADYAGPAGTDGVGTYGAAAATPEAPNTSRSILDGFTTVAKILTRRYVNKAGQKLDVFDLIVGLYQAAGEPKVGKSS